MRSMTRRALVLTQESAGHWFRRSLPPHVFSVAFPAEGEDRENREAARRWRLTDGDWRRFAATYCAGFLAITTFIA